jgi:hypothetical protein
MIGIRGMSRLVLASLALTLLAGSSQQAAFAGPDHEVVTVLLDVTTPAGTAVLGTLVVARGCTAETSAEYVFNGTVNGLPAAAEAAGSEHWGADGHVDVTITAVHNWSIAGITPNILNIAVWQTAPGLLAINGIPLAVDQVLQPPCSSPTSYTVRNAGAGQLSIMSLPNTGAGSDRAQAVPPGLPSATMALTGIGLLVGLSSILALVPGLRRRAGRRRGL